MTLSKRTQFLLAMSHAASYRQNVEADLRGRPNLGVLLFLPYLRVLPMHIAIIFGATRGQGGVATLLLFSALKTAADVCMHSAEHAMLQRGAAQAAKKAAEQG